MFIETLRKPKAPNPLGHLVREITMLSSMDLNELAPLPRLCPFVVEFNDRDLWCPQLSAFLQQWKYLTKSSPFRFLYSYQVPPKDSLGKELTILEVHTKVHAGFTILVTRFPSIEKLHITNMDMARSAIFLDELEVLHKALPNLWFLSLFDVAFTGIIPEYITPCDTVRDLHLVPKFCSLWGQYCARKYSGLEKLKLSLRAADDTDTNSEALTLMRSCRRLKWFEFNCSDPGSINLYQQILEILQEIRAPVEMLQFGYYDAPLYVKAMNDFQGTLSNVRLYNLRDVIVEELVEQLRACLFLVELHMRVSKAKLPLDYVLYNYNLLERRAGTK
ncbi:hypothetical protein DFQ28_002531 [Apophysomyces sp. BC1034]|nr:hypothetical protein DFQ28_002531 [Apophysomyces sp. BC1034]